jgi:hypothetical protein
MFKRSMIKYYGLVAIGSAAAAAADSLLMLGAVAVVVIGLMAGDSNVE